jgi:hypothetical protein
MAVKKVYRGWICFGYSDNVSQKGDLNMIPVVVQELMFGDFKTPSKAMDEFKKYLDAFVKSNPKTQIPRFKLVEHIINTDTNLDVFYINSNRPPTGKERLGDVDINLYYDN